MQVHGDIIKDTLILDPEKDWISWPKSSFAADSGTSILHKIELVLHTFFPELRHLPFFFFFLFEYKRHGDRHKVANCFFLNYLV